MPKVWRLYNYLLYLKMNMQFEKILDESKKRDATSKTQAKKYEGTKCWSYAYLSRWVVLERGLKSLYDSYNKQRIRKGALEWINYLDGKTTIAPNKINDFSVQTKNIPQYGFIEELLGKCDSVKDALNSKEKYRRKRNKIAHTAEEFKSEEKYFDYKQAVDKAIKQLHTKLTQKIRVNK